ncbi:MAG: alpha-glucosidase [Clostridia bacterium]
MKTRWYKDAVFYQIYPRSFCDSNGDGIGDINGIISKLDYLKDLGITAVWLSPCYSSPNDDNGYDISDYRNIMSDFGTLDDWKLMLAEMHKRDIKLVMDLVVNHSSNEHFWFQESRKSKDNPYRDYYIWRKGTGKNGKKPPNNWTSRFTGSAWEYDSLTEEFYLHLFSKKQPDLNWDNPKVRKEIIDICNYWFDLGVDGFRCDVVTYVAKANGLPNGRYIPFMRGDDQFVLAENWYKYINEIAENSWNKYDSYIVGEGPGVDINNVASVIEEGKNVLDGVINFQVHHSNIVKFKAEKYKKIQSRWQNLPEKCWNTLFLENHDQPRVLPMYAKNLQLREVSAKMIAASYLLLKGTPYIYQGQEIGMTNCKFKKNEFVDIMSLNVLNVVKKFPPLVPFAVKQLNRIGRDSARTPMQWNSADNAGFTTGKPWMMVNPNYTEINVENNLNQKHSVLEFYKKLIAIKKKYNTIIKDGVYSEQFSSVKRVFCYCQTLNGKSLYVLCNFSDKVTTLPLPDISFTTSKLLITNYDMSNQFLKNTMKQEFSMKTKYIRM